MSQSNQTETPASKKVQTKQEAIMSWPYNDYNIKIHCKQLIQKHEQTVPIPEHQQAEPKLAAETQIASGY